MGLDAQATKWLLFAKAHGTSFICTATIGRQSMMLDARSLHRLMHQFGHNVSEAEARSMVKEADGYAEPFLRALGATRVRSFDASEYEHATDIVDFNLPIDPSKERFSAVVDAGSLEHIFSFPVAIGNCMRLVEIGGHFISISVANNYFGHGFYQFSPELFYRVFSTENGFRVVGMVACEVRRRSAWFAVVDPAKVGQRVTLVNTEPTYLMVLAQKLADVALFQTPPFQSDYSALWSSPTERAAPVRRSSMREMIAKAYDALPTALQEIVRNARNRLRRNPFDSRFFTRVKPFGSE